MSSPPDALGDRVLGAGAALGWRQAAALRGDRAALDAVGGGYLEMDVAVPRLLAHLVDGGRAHPGPELGELRRHALAHAQVVRRVVPCLVPAQEDRRELVEGETPIRSRVAPSAAAADQLLLGVGLRPRVARR